MKPRKRDARGRFIKDVPQETKNCAATNNEHDSMHQTLREVNRIAEGGEEPTVDKTLKIERRMEKTLHWLFVAFIVWVLWMLLIG